MLTIDRQSDCCYVKVNDKDIGMFFNGKYPYLHLFKEQIIRYSEMIELLALVKKEFDLPLFIP